LAGTLFCQDACIEGDYTSEVRILDITNSDLLNKNQIDGGLGQKEKNKQ